MFELSGPFKSVAVAFKDMFQDDRRVDGIIERLAHQLVVERLVGHVHRQEIHAVARNFFDPRARVFGDALNFFDRQIADHVRLAGKQAGNARRFFFDRLEDRLL